MHPEMTVPSSSVLRKGAPAGLVQVGHTSQGFPAWARILRMSLDAGSFVVMLGIRLTGPEMILLWFGIGKK